MAENMGAQSGADNGNGSGEKTFTQAEVNQIVAERLAREKQKQSAGAPEDITEKYAQAQKELKAYKVREKLAAAGLPAGYADIIRADSDEELEQSIKTLTQMKGKDQESTQGAVIGTGNPIGTIKGHNGPEDDATKKAFGL